MPELGPYGSVRGARGNSRLYRDPGSFVTDAGGPANPVMSAMPRSDAISSGKRNDATRGWCPSLLLSVHYLPRGYAMSHRG